MEGVGLMILENLILESEPEVASHAIVLPNDLAQLGGHGARDSTDDVAHLIPVVRVDTLTCSTQKFKTL